jgi:hypothetical protein
MLLSSGLYVFLDAFPLEGLTTLTLTVPTLSGWESDISEWTIPSLQRFYLIGDYNDVPHGMYQHFDTSFPSLVELACPLPLGEAFLASPLPEVRYLDLSVHYHVDDVSNEDGIDAEELTEDALTSIDFTSFPKLERLTIWGPTESHYRECAEQSPTLMWACHLAMLDVYEVELLVKELDDRASREWWSKE